VKQGGFVVHTTCLLNELHAPPDFWRFTPDGLKLLCSSVAGEVIHVDGWGNQEALHLIQKGFRFAKIPVDPKHPLHRIAVENDKKWLIHTWVIARKPEPEAKPGIGGIAR
jgi:hypothetical protein